MKTFLLFFIAISCVFTTKAQQKDSINSLNQVIITSFKRQIPYLEATSSAARINTEMMQINHPERLVEALNLIPGSKIEERSPGSYRISMRGSTIRSPFGVRNVKIYFDDFIFTDASGNSYLNLIDPAFITSINVLKGPQGGEIGSETGGAILLNSTKKEKISLDILGGSYNMFSEKFNFSKQLGNHFLQIAQAYYNTNSYREQSAVLRKSFFIKDNWSYYKENVLNATVLYTDLHYETPGGLTAAQMLDNPRQARLATATLPSAKAQHAGIYNKTWLAGISHLWKINQNWSQFTLAQTSSTDFKNPFISNYETRKETNFQGRLFVQYKKQWADIISETRAGLEAGTNSTHLNNYDNNRGIKGAPQKFDDLNTYAAFYYLTQHFQFQNKWFVDANISLNSMQYKWKTIFPNQQNGNITFSKQWLPSLGISYKVKPDFTLRAKIAKGNSAPTTEEIRSSNQIIAQNLLAEYGWNKEVGLRKQLGSLFVEGTFFWYDLKDAIVKRQDANGNDYFINSGGTQQLGVEFLVESKLYALNHSFFDAFKFFISGNYYDFTYQDYQVVETNFSGNRLPGISKWAVQSLMSLNFAKRYKLTYSNYYNSNLFLNDANSVKEKGFIVGNLKIDAHFKIDTHTLNVHFGLQNMYNTKYSSGYDLNAFGNRFYNPAAPANFYMGCQFIL